VQDARAGGGLFAIRLTEGLPDKRDVLRFLFLTTLVLDDGEQLLHNHASNVLGYRLLFGITTERHSASARNRVHLPRNSQPITAGL
jgi:hypothetical protein